MALLLPRTRGPIPPMQRADINWTNPLSRGLYFFPLFGGGVPICLVNRCAPTAVGAGTKFGPLGGSNAEGTANNGWYEWQQSWVTNYFSGRTEVTLAISYRATGNNIQASLMTIGNATNSLYTILGNSNPFGWYPNSGSSVPISGISAFQPGLTYFFIGTCNSAACRATVWVNGGLVADSGSTAGIGANLTFSRIRVGDERGTGSGAAAVGSFSPLGEVFYAAAWNRSMTLDKMGRLAANPYAVTTLDAMSPTPGIRKPFIGWGIPTVN